MNRNNEGVEMGRWIEPKEYAKIHARVPISCVDLVIVMDGGLLLVKRRQEPAKGQWFLVGGAVKRGETRVEAVVRKAKEEVGIDVRIIKELGVDETFFAKDPFGHGKGTHTIQTIFLVAARKGERVRLDKNQEDFLVVTQQDYSQYKRELHPYVRKFLEIGFKEQKT